MRLHTALPLLLATGILAHAGSIYATAGDNGQLFIIQGSSITTISDFGTSEYAIAVSGDVRTLGVASGNSGAQYDLNGNPTGTTYLNNFGSEMLDGTTDGSFNYSVQWSQGSVIQFDRNWANGTLLFGGLPSDTIGIAYDPFDNTLWTSDRADGLIQQYSMSGTFLGQFSDPNGPTGLAFDPSDGTLWVLEQTLSNRLDQFTTGGTLLASQNFAELASSNALGLEISSAVPEPGTFIPLGAGLLAAGALRRHRKPA